MTTREILNWGAWLAIVVNFLYFFYIYNFHHDWFVWEPYAVNYIIFGLLWVITED